MAEVDVIEVDRDLFSLACPVAEPVNSAANVLHHLYGWYRDGPSAVSRIRLKSSRICLATALFWV